MLSLLLIAACMSSALGFVYLQTKGPIEQAMQMKINNAIAAVVPAYDNVPAEEKKIIEDIEIYIARKGQEKVGIAVKTYTNKGFNGYISLIVGFLPDGSIYNISVLDQKETPGLGSKMSEPTFINQFRGKDPGNFKLSVKKDGGDVDAITASTISSRAFCDAIIRAYNICKQGGMYE